MRVPSRGMVALAIALGLLCVLLVAADSAQAVGERVEMAPGFDDVQMSDVATIRVTFGSGDDSEQIAVDCAAPNCPDGPWFRTVTHDAGREECGREDGVRVCLVDFPIGFVNADGKAATATSEPSAQTTYSVRLTTGVGTEPGTSFDAWLSTPRTCRENIAQRHEIVRISPTGHEPGDTISIQIRDLDRGKTVLDERRTAPNPSFPLTILWPVPLDYPLGNDGTQKMRVTVSSDTKTETETFSIVPGSPVPRKLVELAPRGQNEPVDRDWNRTETPRFHFQLLYLAAPLDCPYLSPLRKVTPLTPDQLFDGSVKGEVQQVDTTQSTATQDRRFETVGHLRARWVAPVSQYWLNWTIPRDAEATRGEIQGGAGSPQYQIVIPDQRLPDGNVISRFDTEFFKVHPYDIKPRVELLKMEVERLETAKATFNITYEDGSPFTPADQREDFPLRVELRPVGADSAVNVSQLEHWKDGLWNATFPLDFDYEPLGEYRWVLRANEDKHGSDSFHNRIPRTPTNIFNIIVARPVLDFQTFVGSEKVNGTERTRTVHVTLHAEYKNGLPLTSENVDPSKGGIVLNVKKTNRFGRILDVDSLVMTDADQEGNWVRTFRVPRSQDGAPIGTWQLEVVAGDDRDPSNLNRTAFPFEVEPARLTVSPLVRPPSLVEGGEIEYSVRMTYPDGSLYTQPLADPTRGGELNVALNRVNFLNQSQVAVEQRPRAVQNGQEWEFTVEAGKLVPGNHFFEVTGQDIHGNIVGPHTSPLFTVLFDGEFRNSTTPICPGGGDISSLQAQCSLRRGSEVFAVFPASPGDEGVFTEEPIINILRRVQGEDRWVLHRQDIAISPERFRELTGQDPGENHVGYFNTDTSSPTGTYMFTIFGKSRDGIGFAGFSVKFNLSAVVVQREIVQDFPDSVDKGEQLVAIIQHEPGDVPDEAVARVGPVTFGNVEITPVQSKGTFVQWTPPRSAPSGPALINVTGRDLFGNTWQVTLGPFNIEPSRIKVSVAEDPPVELGRNRLSRMETRLVFPNGQAYTDDDGDLEALVIGEDGEQVTEADTRFFQGRWLLEWRPDFDADVGQYRFQVGGRDAAGNIIEPFTSRSFRVVPGIVDAESIEEPGAIRRGTTARSTVTFPAAVENVTATVTTGATDIGEAQVQVDGGTVQLAFPTDRTTELVLARFQLTGSDVLGNTIEMSTETFQINPQQLRVRFLNQPPDFIEKDERVTVRFFIEYPDGSRLRPGDGTPIAGLFARNQPLGTIRPEPVEGNPTIWRATWEPPSDVRTDLPYRFGVSALDRWQNEAIPSETPAFFVENPVVPDYLPVPAPNPLPLIALFGAAALLLGRRGRPGRSR